MTKTWAALNKGNVFFPSSGGHKHAIKVLTRLHVLQRFEERILPGFFQLLGLLVFLGLWPHLSIFALPSLSQNSLCLSLTKIRVIALSVHPDNPDSCFSQDQELNHIFCQIRYRDRFHWFNVDVFQWAIVQLTTVLILRAHGYKVKEIFSFGNSGEFFPMGLQHPPLGRRFSFTQVQSDILSLYPSPGSPWHLHTWFLT